MDPKLERLLDLIRTSSTLSEDERKLLQKNITDVEKEMEIISFKLERTEKIKKTTGILLEKTIEELEEKRKAVEAQNRELEIEAALERVRSRAIAMQNSDELNGLIGTVFAELTKLELELTRCVICIYDMNTLDARWWMANGEDPSNPMNFFLPYHEHKPYMALLNAWKKRQTKFVYDLNGKVKKEWDDFIFTKTGLSGLPEAVKQGMSAPDRVLLTATFNNFGFINVASLEPVSDKQFDIVLRFAKVFEGTYTRFNDLKQAEAQAREAQIESALEKVRSTSMAMRKSSDLHHVTNTVKDQLIGLGFNIDAVNFVTDYNEEGYKMWLAAPGVNFPQQIYIPQLKQKLFSTITDAVAKGKDFITYTLSKEEKDAYFRNFFENTILKSIDPQDKQGVYDRKGLASSMAIVKNIRFSVSNFDGVPYSPQENEVIRRFAGVFEQSYVRFLDLQTAEAQAREAQIEASLERVRASAMAMHKSEDLNDAVAVVFEQLAKLDLEVLRCGIGIVDKEKCTSNVWVTTISGEAGPVQISGDERFDIHPLLQGTFDSWLKQEDFTYELKGEDMLRYYQAQGSTNFHLPESQLILSSEDKYVQYYHASMFEAGGVFAFRETTFPDEAKKILKRFAGVFNLTYQRFLDIQKAEAQAREANIEAALERVRSKAMSMHQSADLTNAVTEVFEQLAKLNIGVLRCGIGIMNREKRTADVWVTTVTAEGCTVPVTGDESFDIHPLLQGAYNSWLNQTDFSYVLKGEDMIKYYRALGDTNFHLPESQLKLSTTDDSYIQDYYVAMFEAGGLFAFREGLFPDEAKVVLRRFAGVFNLTYKRFLDIQKAELQAREAKIEASLERVRGKAMAMHSSEDLSETIQVFYNELGVLNIIPRRCGVSLINKETRIGELSTMNTTENGESLVVNGNLLLANHPVLDGAYEHWLSQKEFFPVLRGNEISEYYRILRPQVSFPDYPHDVVQYGYYFFFPEGAVFAWSETKMGENDLNIYRRFTSVLSLTYKRYSDLKNAEARAVAATREASLDRIRAEIASMRTSEDLARITPAVWKELTTLGVPFFRCGVFIVNEQTESFDVYLSTPDGKALSTLSLSFDSSPTTSRNYEHWRKQEFYFEKWDGKQFSQWVQSLAGQGRIDKPETYQGGDVPPECLALQFVPFAQGLLYVGSTELLPSSQIEVIQLLADAFSIAYARYEDFKKLEEAKEQVESALTELKATQGQLIQSEKMASLGELTAGIAHEIQNPLNFVNNFSEVNLELLAEMKEELDNGKFDDAKALADNVMENEEKIHHHGKRADGIVKGMLQHSRSSNGQKEPTEINVLAEEYLRLAYHGLRAKDKSFNAMTRTDFDESIGRVNMIPQDIGRAILNLITNAFYAVAEKKKQRISDYEPFVSVSTRKINDRIAIRVSDNGNGIPQKVIDKIFQPFFTTKPAGQGTGLGLSLSYDIVKAHGGEIRVETKEGAGTEFIIELPVS